MLRRLHLHRRRRQARRKQLLLWGGVILGSVGLWKALDFVKDYFQAHPHSDTKEKIVVVGTGFGSLSMVSELDCEQFDVTIVSPRGYFLYTPLLAAATVGGVATERYGGVFFCLPKFKVLLSRFVLSVRGLARSSVFLKRNALMWIWRIIPFLAAVSICR